MDDLSDSLPDNSPRFVILSYPISTDGRIRLPYVLLYWIPQTCTQQSRMLYAGAVEFVRNEAGVGKLIKLEDEEELEDLEELVK